MAEINNYILGPIDSDYTVGAITGPDGEPLDIPADVITAVNEFNAILGKYGLIGLAYMIDPTKVLARLSEGTISPGEEGEPSLVTVSAGDPGMVAVTYSPQYQALASEMLSNGITAALTDRLPPEAVEALERDLTERAEG